MEATERNPRLEKYYTAHIALGGDKWLVFDRIVDYQDGERDAIQVVLKDNTLQTTSALGLWYDGRWTSPNDYVGNKLWEYMKPYDVVCKRIMKRLRTPLKEFKPFLLEWNCLKRRFRFESIKIKRKIKK
jgi:hypothetical protein